MNIDMGNYANVNGLKIFYEVHGTGSPLIILHGGVGASEMFSSVLPKLSEDRQVIAIHLQGHGRTTDIDRPFSLEQMADDTAELLRRLKIEGADLLVTAWGRASLFRWPFYILNW